MMIDPELNYCPRCQDEYRAEIERCAVCEAELLSGRDMLAIEERREERRRTRRGELTPEDELVAIQKGPLAEMKPLEELLAAENIGTMLASDERSCGGSCCPSTFYLTVRREDAQDAMMLIEAEHRRLSALAEAAGSHGDGVFDPMAGVATCPACGHTFATTDSTCPDCGLCFG